MDKNPHSYKVTRMYNPKTTLKNGLKSLGKSGRTFLELGVKRLRKYQPVMEPRFPPAHSLASLNKEERVAVEAHIMEVETRRSMAMEYQRRNTLR